MRVLTFTSLFPNSADPSHGIFIYRRVAAAAEDKEFEAEVIAPVPFVPGWIESPSRNKFARVPEAENVGGLRVHHPRYPLLPKVSMSLHGFLMYLGVRKLAQRLHRQKPFDCIDAHYVYPDGFAAVKLGKLLGIPVVVSARGTDINLFPSFRTIRPQIRWTLRNSAGIISVSSDLKRRMIELGVPENKIAFIGNGVETDLFRPTERQQARKALNIPENTSVLVSVASLRESKGHQHVIAALAKIAPRYPSVRLYLIGEGDYRVKLEELVEKLGIQDRVFLVGNRGSEEIPLWFNAADVSILASSREGWPNVVLESLACGTPVIGTPAGQIPEILCLSQPGGSSEFGIVAESTPDSLAAAMEVALRKVWNRSVMASYAHARPWSLVAAEVRSYFNKVVGVGTAITTV